MTGGDVAPLGSTGVTAMHKVFDWAKTSRRGWVDLISIIVDRYSLWKALHFTFPVFYCLLMKQMLFWERETWWEIYLLFSIAKKIKVNKVSDNHLAHRKELVKTWGQHWMLSCITLANNRTSKVLLSDWNRVCVTLLSIIKHCFWLISRFMLVLASNLPEQFDTAIKNRIDEMVKFDLPNLEERERLVRLYFDKFILQPAASGAK